MSKLDSTLVVIPPACPVCGKSTVLKERFKSERPSGDTWFFKCADCSLEYPVYAPDLRTARASPETP